MAPAAGYGRAFGAPVADDHDKLVVAHGRVDPVGVPAARRVARHELHTPGGQLYAG